MAVSILFEDKDFEVIADTIKQFNGKIIKSENLTHGFQNKDKFGNQAFPFSIRKLSRILVQFPNKAVDELFTEVLRPMLADPDDIRVV